MYFTFKRSYNPINTVLVYVASLSLLLGSVVFIFLFFLTIFIALHDTLFTILNTTNITYNTHNTSHNNHIYIINNTYYTYKTKSSYNVHTTYRNNAVFQWTLTASSQGQLNSNIFTLIYMQKLL